MLDEIIKSASALGACKQIDEANDYRSLTTLFSVKNTTSHPLRYSGRLKTTLKERVFISIAGQSIFRKENIFV